MSNEHAMRFPFVGSAMLLSLFLLFKFLSKDLVNAVLTCYFFVLGIIALSYGFFSVAVYSSKKKTTISGNLIYPFDPSKMLLLLCAGQHCYLVLSVTCQSVGTRTSSYGIFHTSVVCDLIFCLPVIFKFSISNNLNVEV